MEEQKQVCEEQVAAARKVEARAQEDLECALKQKAEVFKRCAETENKLLVVEVCTRCLFFVKTKLFCIYTETDTVAHVFQEFVLAEEEVDTAFSLVKYVQYIVSRWGQIT